MQEQSQAPALGGKETLLSYEALSGLVELAKGRNAHPVLLMTWGYLEGDKQEHPTIFPDYHAMQVLCFVELRKLCPLSILRCMHAFQQWTSWHRQCST